MSPNQLVFNNDELNDKLSAYKHTQFAKIVSLDWLIIRFHDH